MGLHCCSHSAQLWIQVSSYWKNLNHISNARWNINFNSLPYLEDADSSSTYPVACIISRVTKAWFLPFLFSPSNLCKVVQSLDSIFLYSLLPSVILCSCKRKTVAATAPHGSFGSPIWVSGGVTELAQVYCSLWDWLPGLITVRGSNS